MSSTNIDYVDTYFEFPSLTRIHGEPNYDSLKIVKDELRSNATSVTSDLGGGAHGHLGLVLTDVEYQVVSPTAYNRPNHPGPLIIPIGTAQHEATRLREEHKTSIRLFRETIDVEKALIKQLVAAIEPKYLKSLRNDHTNAIDVSISAVLTHLFEKHGVIVADTLDEQETKVKGMKYVPTEPFVTVTNAIEELARIANAAENPYSDAQKVQMGIRIVKNTNDFEDGLRTWYLRPGTEKTGQTSRIILKPLVNSSRN